MQGRRVLWGAPRAIEAYVFVDASLPLDGKSRLEDIEVTSPQFAADLRRHLAAGGRYPDWSEADLRELIPDDRLRHAMIAKLCPRALDFFEERLPGFAHDTDAARGYSRFSEPYVAPAASARAHGWVVHTIDAGHFHMLVDPPGVAAAIVDLVQAVLGSGC